MSDAETLQQFYNKTKRQRKLSQRFSPEVSRELTADLVNDIRYRRIVGGETCNEIAQALNYDRQMVWRIGAGLAFKEVPFDDRLRGAIEALKAQMEAGE